MEELVNQIKDKKEFKELPDCLIKNVLQIKEIDLKKGSDKIKFARAFLRKYFSVFMTNKIVSGKLSENEILKKHLSTKNRDYARLYSRLLDNKRVIIDLGAGLNGFSYNYLPSGSRYVAIEAIGIFVDLMNKYFKKEGLNAMALQEDLFNLDEIIKIIEKESGSKIIFLFNVIDALERIKRDYSKDLLLQLGSLGEKIVISFPMRSLTGKNQFKVKRFWLINFIEKNFKILDNFEMYNEKFIVFQKK